MSQLFRNAINDDIYSMKQGEQCTECGSCFDLHVHHEIISFKSIVDTFLKQNPSYKPTGFIRIGISHFSFKPEEEYIRDAFVEYHNSVCTLKIVCRQCHMYIHHTRDTTRPVHVA